MHFIVCCVCLTSGGNLQVLSILTGCEPDVLRELSELLTKKSFSVLFCFCFC